MSKMHELLRSLNLTPEQAELAREAMAERAAERGVRFKVSGKGCVSIYGIHSRFPVSLYLSQLRRIRDEGVIEAAIAYGEIHGAAERTFDK